MICLFIYSILCKNVHYLKLLQYLFAIESMYDVAKKNNILCIWCNAMYLCGLKLKKHIIFNILYIIVSPLCSTFLKRIDFYKAHHSEMRGVL